MSKIRPKGAKTLTEEDIVTKINTSVRKEQIEIYVKGARSNNLKNIDLRIPKNQLIVVTGLSGSGKSSLVMDTLYAEGQRRYVESLSSYARQFLMRMKKPEVDYIKGICPAIAIEQKVSTHNPRSTVGTMTEIYDYLRLLYARIGKTISPVSGKPVKKHSISDVVDFIMRQSEGAKVILSTPLQKNYPDRLLKQEFNYLLQKGFTRVIHQGAIVRIEDALETEVLPLKKKIKSINPDLIQILVDRFIVHREDDELPNRIADSVLSCFHESEGECLVAVDKRSFYFNNRFELDGITFLIPTPQLFNFNNSFGACPKCEGYGRVMGIDEQKVIPDARKSIYEGAVACWSGEKSSRWLDRFIRNSHADEFPIHRPYLDLTDEEKDLLWNGATDVAGIYDFFSELEKNLYKIQNRVLLARYRGKTTCPVCKGGRLREEATYVKIVEKSLNELIALPIDELYDFFGQIELSDHDQVIAKRILYEIKTRLRIMTEMGLGYLSLNRLAATLSGGETQRINLTRTLGSNLTNSLYILDEPSVGLHPKDTHRLVEVLKSLRDLRNTVIVVEHEEQVIRNTDYIIDMGPRAGIHGGEVVYQGTFQEFMTSQVDSLTRSYLTGELQVSVEENKRNFTNKLLIQGARQHNLKNINVSIPLNTLTVISGVSGSGKTTLVKHILYPALKKHLGEAYASAPGIHSEISGDLSCIQVVEFINQNPIGKSSRSNPITYVKAYDSIRALMAKQQLSKIKGYKPGHFSFNTEGGRCEKCKGEGVITVEMQFLADIKLICEDCKGKRFKQEVLDVEFKGLNIFDILELSIEEALNVFKDKRDIIQKIKPLNDVGLGYVKLGQASSTLSGGEAQRVKLASYLGKGGTKNDSIFFIFDEPTTGLHFHDVQKLLDALNALVEKGHTVVVVEHNLDVIMAADWVVDLGPGGGKDGGQLVFEGRPENLVSNEDSYTGMYLKQTEKLYTS